ncbi:MAG: LysE family translocator, partial [Proteobacteria bacterium]|nr:LysE family translocator [Pseudomonadota bacterium]
GACGHVLMAALGLSAILVTSAIAFSVVKWAGAAYLIWLGIRALRSDGGRFVSEGMAKAKSFGAIYRQGILIALLNPKVAIFFLAFLPQFVVEGAGPISGQLFLHGTLIIVVAAFIEPPLVIAGARLVSGLQENRKFGLWLDRTLGAMFVALGVKLVLTRQ